MDTSIQEIIDAAAKLGAGAVLVKAWDWFASRYKDRDQDALARFTITKEYEKTVLSNAATMVEALVKDLRDDVSRLREQVAALSRENEQLKEENLQLRERIKNLEEYRP